MEQELPLYLDSTKRAFVAGPQSSQEFKMPVLYQGDNLRITIHSQRPNPDLDALEKYVPEDLAFSSIKVAISPGPDVLPASGTFKVRLIGQTETTATLPFPITQAAFAAALNALPTVQALHTAAGGTGDAISLAPQAADGPLNIWVIRWVKSTITAQFEIIENRLEPLCFSRSLVKALPVGQVQQIKVFVAPLAFTDQFAYPENLAVSTDGVRIGTGTQNCVQSITVPAGVSGGVSLKFASNSTSIIAAADLAGTNDGASKISAALNGLYSDNVTRFKVAKQHPGYYYVEFTGPLEKTAQALLEADMHDQAPSGAPTALLDLGGPDLEFFQRGQKQLKLRFEVEIIQGNSRMTPIQSDVTIINDIIDDGMAIQGGPPGWIVPDDYENPPSDPTPTVEATRGYVTAIGNGSATTFWITHNLDSLNCHVSVRENAGERLGLVDNSYTKKFPNANQAVITFPTPPALNEFEVVITAVKTTELFLPAHHHVIADIDGLQAILDALQGQGNPLDLWPSIPVSKLPRLIPWRNEDDDSLRFPVPMPRELLPPGVPYFDDDGNWVVTYPGPPPFTRILLDPTGHFPVELLPLDPSTWPGLEGAIIKALQNNTGLIPPGIIPITIPEIKALSLPPMAEMRPGMLKTEPSLARGLPAFTTGAGVSGALTFPTVALNNVVSTVLDAASAEAVRHRSPTTFGKGAKVGCDGRQYFEVFTDGANAYPSEMERELFTLHITPRMLDKNCRFAFNGQLTIALTGPAAESTRASYVLRVRFGHKSGPLLSAVTWDSDAIAETIIVASAAVTHTFGVSVTSAAVTGALSAQSRFYGRNSDATAPTGNAFVVQGSLTKFDLEDVSLAAQGQVLFSHKGTASVVDLSQT